MTKREYQHKRSLYQTSDAPKEVKEEAIKKLDEEYRLNTIDKRTEILNFIQESSPDMEGVLAC